MYIYIYISTLDYIYIYIHIWCPHNLKMTSTDISHTCLTNSAVGKRITARTSFSSLFSSNRIKGRIKASVLPLPVGAATQISLGGHPIRITRLSKRDLKAKNIVILKRLLSYPPIVRPLMCFTYG